MLSDLFRMTIALIAAVIFLVFWGTISIHMMNDPSTMHAVLELKSSSDLRGAIGLALSWGFAGGLFFCGIVAGAWNTFR